MIIHGDCLNILPTLADEFVDLVLTDCPYNISNEVVISRGSQGKYKGNDITSDFGEWDNFVSSAEYERFTEIWCRDCFRVLKPGGFLISFFDKRRLSLIPDILEPLGMKTKDIISWIKRNPVPQVRKVKFAQASEMAIVMSKPGPNRFQWQNGYHPNYIKLPIVGGHQRLKDEEGKTLHMTQKPLMLFRWLIDYFCEPWGMVLDPFAGTMTTHEAAILSGRRVMCIEREKKYVDAGIKRIELIQKDLFPVDYKSKEYKLKYL